MELVLYLETTINKKSKLDFFFEQPKVFGYSTKIIKNYTSKIISFVTNWRCK